MPPEIDILIIIVGAHCQTRTGMPLRATDFKSVVSTIPPSGHRTDTNFSCPVNQEDLLKKIIFSTDQFGLWLSKFPK